MINHILYGGITNDEKSQLDHSFDIWMSKISAQNHFQRGTFSDANY